MLRWERLLWVTLSLLVTLARLQCKSMLFLLSRRRETWWLVPRQVSSALKWKERMACDPQEWGWGRGASWVEEHLPAFGNGGVSSLWMQYRLYCVCELDHFERECPPHPPTPPITVHIIGIIWPSERWECHPSHTSEYTNEEVLEMEMGTDFKAKVLFSL